MADDPLVPPPRAPLRSPDTTWQDGPIAQQALEARLGQRGCVLWFTGLSGAGKSTIARAVTTRLFAAGAVPQLLDGDNVRHGLCGDLGFSPAARDENVRRVAHVAGLFCGAGLITSVALISPYSSGRAQARALVPGDRFLEILVDADSDTCARRDPKGLWARALRGELPDFTGVSAPYERPLAPELTLDTRALDVVACVDLVVELLRSRGIAPPASPA